MASKNHDPDIEETVDDYIKRHATSVEELRTAIEFLIRRRELLRDCEIELLEHESIHLEDALRSKRQQILLEELECFKEVLAIHKRLLERADD